LKQEWLEKSLKDQLSRLQKKLYGCGREAFKKKDHRSVGHDGEQLRLHGEYTEPDQSSELEDNKELNSAPVVVHDASAEYLAEESLLRDIKGKSEAWSEVKDFHQDSYEITVTEQVYQKVIHRQKKYRLKDEYNTTGKEVIITAPGPVKVKPGCQYSVDFALAVASDKYEFHLPLERQRRRMEAAGLDVEVKTLYSLCESVAEHCEAVREDIRQDIMNDFCAVHMDESPWRILGEKETGQMWVLSNRLGSFCQFEPTRSGKVAEEIIEGYEGAVVTDGYAGYNALRKSEKIRVGQCWAHARREFFERLDSFPIECEEALNFIDRIFFLESQARNFDELKELRKTEIKVVVEDFHQWLLKHESRYLVGDGLTKAVKYCLKLWTELTLFLRDLSVPLDNNDAERALRHVVMGKKNFAGSKTINGADTAAILYTVIETAKKVGLQPKEYLKYLITERWHKRKPLSPHRFVVEKRNGKPRVNFPAKEAWQI